MHIKYTLFNRLFLWKKRTPRIHIILNVFISVLMFLFCKYNRKGYIVRDFLYYIRQYEF